MVCIHDKNIDLNIGKNDDGEDIIISMFCKDCGGEFFIEDMTLERYINIIELDD